MVIDSHVHLRHGDSERNEYTPEVIVQVMDAVGIDRSVVFAMCCSTPRSIEMAHAAARAFPDRLIPYAYALPEPGRSIVPDIEDAVTQLGFRGIKIHRGECDLADPALDPVLRFAAERRVPCVVDFLGLLPDLERMASGFPGLDIIVAHLGKYLCEDGELIDRFIETAGRFPRVCMDTSGVILPGKIREAVRRLGASRIVFGSDGPGPRSDPARVVRSALATVRKEGLSRDEETAILGGNIAGFLKL